MTSGVFFEFRELHVVFSEFEEQRADLTLLSTTTGAWSFFALP
jgi:hypothetical protein